MAKWIKLAAVILLTVGLLLAVAVGQWRYSSPAVARLIDRADKIVVLRKYREDRPEVAFTSTDRADFDALKKALKLTAGDMRCKCDGDPAIVLYSGGRKIGVISNQHGRFVSKTDGRTTTRSWPTRNRSSSGSTSGASPTRGGRSKHAR